MQNTFWLEVSLLERVQVTLQGSQRIETGLQIDFEDFKAYASRKEDTIANSFAKLDVDHNGSISVNDLVSFFWKETLKSNPCF